MVRYGTAKIRSIECKMVDFRDDHRQKGWAVFLRGGPLDGRLALLPEIGGAGTFPHFDDPTAERPSCWLVYSRTDAELAGCEVWEYDGGFQKQEDADSRHRALTNGR